MRVLLVRPARTPQSVTLGEIMFSEPLGLEMVVSALKEDHDVEVLDLMAVEASGKKGAAVRALEERLAALQPEVVGLTSLCVDVMAVRQLAARVKALSPQTFVVAGGTQAFLNPEAFVVPEIDVVVQVSTKEGLKALFKGIENEKGKRPGKETELWLGTGPRQTMIWSGTGLRQKTNAYWLPDRTSTKAWRGQYAYFGFRPCAILQTSQGCSAHCDFCLRWRMEGPCERDFPMDFVMEDLKTIEEPSLMIFDNDFLNNGERLEEFCDRLDQAGLHKSFICYASVHSVLKNPEAILSFRDHGLKAVLVGYESFSDEELEAYKKPSRSGDAFKAAKWLKSAGIDVWASFMLHPDWTHDDFKALRRHIKRLAPEIATFSPLTPFPGLPLYKHYKDQDRLLFKEDDYSAWSFGQVIIRPGRMSLRAYYYEVLKTILYLNFVSNHTNYITKKFGAGTLIRMSGGAVRVFFRYVGLMLGAKAEGRGEKRNVEGSGGGDG
ncbi:B12-binding domain-containing radical SAM protein [Acidaminobacter hydrogenoformans]|uniref:Radical SAM superfamily enzyme YgiQ, UPF0313 family n=1 Tax=Acidaminobacter hydrogenoformans DSM 2784 TaxID=1120920 RepID=A0A1G5S089_9FIRM|nr:radical SAM protein [Acidaminobacter hydrogenoformans]SCZ78999.1 Radical SAM superfamily enzyme YgiQ, UPF0313 family [Acidaminobacter hydrogenoformans DSM 2784]